MDIQYIKPFLTAIQRVFDTMIDIPLKLGKPQLKKAPEPSYEVCGIIGLSGPVKGCVAISLSEELALKLSSIMYNEEITEFNEDCTDAIGEIANIITGNAKDNFPENDITISTPSVIIGKHRVTYPRSVPIISIPCKVDRWEIVIDVAIKLNG